MMKTIFILLMLMIGFIQEAQKIPINEVQYHELYNIEEAETLLKKKPILSECADDNVHRANLNELQRAVASIYMSEERNITQKKDIFFSFLNELSQDKVFCEIVKNARNEKGVYGVWDNASFLFRYVAYCAITEASNEQEFEKINSALRNIPDSPLKNKMISQIQYDSFPLIAEEKGIFSKKEAVDFSISYWMNVLFQWQGEIMEWKQQHPDFEYVFLKTNSYYRMLKVDISYFPDMVQYAKQDSFPLIEVFSHLTKIKFSSYFRGDKVMRYTDYPNYSVQRYMIQGKGNNIWFYWWDEGRKLTPQIFARKYADYQAARQAGKEEDIKAKYTLLQNMGVIILPNLLEKIEAGETDLIPMFGYLSDQKDLKTAADCRTWWDANKKRYEVILDYQQKGNVKK